MKTFDILRMHHSGVEVDDGCVIVSLRVMGEGCKWLTLVDDNGTPKFYSSQEDIFALHKKGEVRSWLKEIETCRINEFEGLKLGEKVVISGISKLAPGMKVTLVEATGNDDLDPNFKPRIKE